MVDDEYEDPDVAAERRADEAEVAEALRLLDMETLVQSLPFRRYIWSLLSVSGLYINGFSTDPLMMAFAAGKREIGLRILKDITTADPSVYVKMQQENAP